MWPSSSSSFSSWSQEESEAWWEFLAGQIWHSLLASFPTKSAAEPPIWFLCEAYFYLEAIRKASWTKTATEMNVSTHVAISQIWRYTDGYPSTLGGFMAGIPITTVSYTLNWICLNMFLDERHACYVFPCTGPQSIPFEKSNAWCYIKHRHRTWYLYIRTCRIAQSELIQPTTMQVAVHGGCLLYTSDAADE